MLGQSQYGRGSASGREIRAWYLRGGGRPGNVADGVLIVLKAPIRDVIVENRRRASGGEDMETLDAAVSRGREVVRVLRSAVTARDFENIASEVPGIARARAYAQRDVWTFGRPGTVDVLVVPTSTHRTSRTAITAAVLAAYQTPELIANVRDYVRRRRPVGVESRVEWVRCRAVDITARVVLLLGSRTTQLLPHGSPAGCMPCSRPMALGRLDGHCGPPTSTRRCCPSRASATPNC